MLETGDSNQFLSAPFYSAPIPSLFRLQARSLHRFFRYHIGLRNGHPQYDAMVRINQNVADCSRAVRARKSERPKEQTLQILPNLRRHKVLPAGTDWRWWWFSVRRTPPWAFWANQETERHLYPRTVRTCLAGILQLVLRGVQYIPLAGRCHRELFPYLQAKKAIINI